MCGFLAGQVIDHKTFILMALIADDQRPVDSPVANHIFTISADKKAVAVTFDRCLVGFHPCNGRPAKHTDTVVINRLFISADHATNPAAIAQIRPVIAAFFVPTKNMSPDKGHLRRI